MDNSYLMPVEPVNEHAKPLQEKLRQIFVDGKGKTCTATVLFLLIKSENWIEIARAMTKLDVNHMFCIANLRNKIRLFPIREGLLKGFQCLRTSTVNHKCCKSSPYINESCARYLHRSIAIVLV